MFTANVFIFFCEHLRLSRSVVEMYTKMQSIRFGRGILSVSTSLILSIVVILHIYIPGGAAAYGKYKVFLYPTSHGGKRYYA